MLIRDCVHSGSCPFGIVSIRDGVHSGLCPFGMVSIRDCAFRNRVHWGNCPDTLRHNTKHFWIPRLSLKNFDCHIAMNNNKLPGIFADISFDKNYKKKFSELDKNQVKLPVMDQSPQIKFYNRTVTVSITLLESKTMLNASEINFH